MAKLCYYAVFGIKISTTEHEIMLPAMLLKSGSRTFTYPGSWHPGILAAWDELGQRVIDTAV